MSKSDTLSRLNHLFDVKHKKMLDDYRESDTSPNNNKNGDMYEELACHLLELMGCNHGRGVKLQVYSASSCADIACDVVVYNNQGTPSAYIECKTYLDACFLKRFTADCMYLSKSYPDMEFFIFCGQNNTNEESFKFYKEEFERIIGKEFNLYYILDMGDNVEKKRSYKKTDLFRNEDYKLDIKVISKMYDKLKSMKNFQSQLELFQG